MQTQPLPHVGLLYPEGLPREIVDEFVAGVRRDGIEVAAHEKDSFGVYAAAEWFVIPTAAILYLGRKYFDAVFDGLVDAHVTQLKGAVKALYVRLNPIKMQVVASRGKVSGEPPYSLTFSIMAEAGPGRAMKFMMAADAEGPEAERALDAFIDLVRSYHDGTLDPTLLSAIDEGPAMGGTTCVTFDHTKGAVSIVDPQDRLKKAAAAAHEEHDEQGLQE